MLADTYGSSVEERLVLTIEIELTSCRRSVAGERNHTCIGIDSIGERQRYLRQGMNGHRQLCGCHYRLRCTRIACRQANSNLVAIGELRVTERRLTGLADYNVVAQPLVLRCSACVRRRSGHCYLCAFAERLVHRECNARCSSTVHYYLLRETCLATVAVLHGQGYGVRSRLGVGVYDTAAIGVISLTVAVNIPCKGCVVIRAGSQVGEVHLQALAYIRILHDECRLSTLAELVGIQNAPFTVSLGAQVEHVLAVGESIGRHIVVLNHNRVADLRERDAESMLQVVIKVCFHSLYCHRHGAARYNEERVGVGLSPNIALTQANANHVVCAVSKAVGRYRQSELLCSFAYFERCSLASSGIVVQPPLGCIDLGVAVIRQHNERVGIGLSPCVSLTQTYANRVHTNLQFAGWHGQ